MAKQLFKNGEQISGSGVVVNSAAATNADVVDTTGAETVSDGTETITVATRDTAQDITARKRFQADIIIDTDLSMIADEGDPQPSQSIIFPGGSSIMENFTDAFGFGDSSSNELKLTSLADGGTTEVRIHDTGLSTNSGIRLGSAEPPTNNGITFEDGTSQTTAATGLDYLTESIEDQPATSVTVSALDRAIGVFQIFIVRVFGDIAIGSRFTYMGVEYLIRNALAATNDPSRNSGLTIHPNLEAAITIGTVLQIEPPMLTTIESHLALPDLPHRADGLSFGQLYSSGGVVQIAGDSEASGTVVIRTGLTGEGQSSAGRPTLVLENDLDLTSGADSALSSVRSIHPDGDGNQFEFVDIVSTAVSNTAGAEEGGVEIIVASAGVRASKGFSSNTGVTHKFTSLGIETPAITFPDSTTPLDDYEEGTWTPAPGFLTATDGSGLYINPAGAYTKVGRQVVCSFRFTVPANTDTSQVNFIHNNASFFPFLAGDYEGGIHGSFSPETTVTNSFPSGYITATGNHAIFYGTHIAGGSISSISFSEASGETLIGGFSYLTNA